jgi:hypothetical protein
MKRKVRITPPASNPFESNSMSTWMAQMGGSQMGQNQPTEEEHIYSIAAEMLSQGFDIDEVKKSLAGNGFAGAKVNELVDSLVAYVEDQRDLSEAQYLEDELAQEQLLAEEEAAAAQSMEEEAMNNQMYDEMYYAESDPGYAEEDAVMQDILMQFGGKVPTKKEFVKRKLQLKKKQEGGQEKQNKADDTFAQKRPLNDFISSVSQTAQQKAEEEMLGQEYDNYFGAEDGLEEAQRGGQRRMMRRANRMMRRMPAGMMAPGQMFPPQFNIMTAPGMFPMANMSAGQMQMPGNIQMANIEVRRTGIFGKPKEYTINFATTPPAQIKPQEVIDQEKENIKQTQKDVAVTEKEKEVTTASKDNEKVQEELVTADQITVKGKGSGTKGASKPQANAAAAGKVDAWGRSEGDKWYNFDPEQKKYVNQVSPAKAIVDKANSFAPVKSPFGEAWDEFGRAVKLQYEQEAAEEKARLDQMDPATRWYYENVHKNNNSGKSLFPKNNNSTAVSNRYAEINAKAKEKQIPAVSNIANRIYDAGSNISSYLSNEVPQRALSIANETVAAPNIFADQARRAFQQQGGITGQDLYKFIYGGDEMMPFADESFMYNSKDTTDPYFQYGGLNEYQEEGEVEEEKVDNTGEPDNTKNTFSDSNKKRYEALKEIGYNVGDYREGIDYTKINTQRNQTQQKQTNPMYNPQVGAMYPPVFGNRRFRPPGRTIEYAGSWAQQKGMPFDPRTGQPIMGLPSSNLPLSKIDVTKTSMFGKRPKEYTMYFGDYGKGQTPQGAAANAPGAQQSPNQLRQYSKAQGLLAKIPGLSKFVGDPKGDYVSAEGFVSPKDLSTVGSLPTRKATVIPTSADELRSRQEYQLDGAPMQLPTRQASMIPTQSGADQELLQSNFNPSQQIPEPYFTDEELAAQNQLVDVEPEDFSQTYNPLPSELAENRDPSRVSPIIDIAGPRADMSYSEDEFYEDDEYRNPYSPEREFMFESLGRGASTVPFYPIGADAPLIGPEASANYINQAMNYNMNLPSPSQSPEPWMTQEMVDDSNRRYQERIAATRRAQELKRQQELKKQQETKRENIQNETVNKPTQNIQNEKVFDNKVVLDSNNNETYAEFEDKQDIYTDPESGRSYDRLHPSFQDAKGNFDKKKFDNAVEEGRRANEMKVQQKEKDYIKKQTKLYKGAGFPTEYIKNPNKMSNWLHNKPDMLYWVMEEPQSLYTQGWKPEDVFEIRKNYAKWAREKGVNDWREKYIKQYDKGDILKEVESKQVGGLTKSNNLLMSYLPMAQAGVNQNSVNNQDDSQIPMMKPRSSQEVWAATEPQIREAWGLGQKDATPEIEQNPFAVKFKNKNMYNIDFERGVNQFNTGANMFLSAVGERGDREREAQMFNNLTADNLYSASNTINRGNYDPNSGLFRQDEMGFTGVAKKGGSTYKEGGQTYMSAKQIADFLANGGEIEFI